MGKARDKTLDRGWLPHLKGIKSAILRHEGKDGSLYMRLKSQLHLAPCERKDLGDSKLDPHLHGTVPYLSTVGTVA